MQHEPYHDEEHMRLRRKGDREESGFSFGWVLMPALLGMLGALVLTRVIPHIATSLSERMNMSRIMSKLATDLDREFSLLMSFQWGETRLWLYLLIGAVVGVTARYFYTSDKID